MLASLLGPLFLLLPLAGSSYALQLAVRFSADHLHEPIQLTGGWWPALLAALVCVAFLAIWARTTMWIAQRLGQTTIA
ncbi:hypothetical protein M878_45200 [Streptomyces roseochromogenus subsp. oscitans DS 12.976]|uniref:Uncharacterized protein n=1 Tax=Streptomyces roseochromogenus subsp. oscitans DS 12.976 TaxID=1352936 RepID=V6JFB0_STRRC|nr:hypothetical protein M878_45200 [Streptomyces roseochromogenus subsp. oscitans DS 12.976]